MKSATSKLFLTHTMNFDIGSALSKGLRSAFSEGPGRSPGPLYEVCRSNPQVTSSNPQVAGSNLQVTSSNPRVRRLKARVARLEARVEAIKPRVK